MRLAFRQTAERRAQAQLPAIAVDRQAGVLTEDPAQLERRPAHLGLAEELRPALENLEAKRPLPDEDDEPEQEPAEEPAEELVDAEAPDR